ncbi:hypothetical protein [Paenibacillus polymyxa]|uniref:Uncharacterized protein n=1 Tax=Paenibacillus polymyxa TaxID=1406 RepID=A0AAP4EAZ1_PAEPO|nr:hypothetical protein [Paenibacillus polymyxa]MDH2332480.1 hypothetical protein [Paenibacillus polymyxa]
MKPEKERLALEKLKESKRYYARFKTKELELLKAGYEADEEDNKQIGVIIALITIGASFMSLSANLMMKVNTYLLPLALLLIYIIGISGVTYMGWITSVRNVKTTRTRKIIDIVLAERAAAKAKQNPPTPTP